MPRYASRLSPALGLLLWSLGSAANAQHSLLFGDTLGRWSVQGTTAGNIGVHADILRVAEPAGWLQSNPGGHIGIQAETGALEFRAIEIAPRGPN